MLSCKWLTVLAGSVLAVSAQSRPADVTYDYTGAPLIDHPAFQGYDPYGPDVMGTASFDPTVVTANYTGEAQSVAATLGTGYYEVFAYSTWSNGVEPSFDFLDGKIVGWSLKSTVTFAPFYLVPITSTSYGGDTVYPLSGGPEILGSASTNQIGSWTRVSAVPEPGTWAMWLAGMLSFMSWRRRSK